MHTLIIPNSFETGHWAPPVDRPPFYNLLIYVYHELFGISLYQYWFSQIISVIASSAFIIPAYLIAKKLFGIKVAKLSAAFILVNPYLFYYTIYTYPKNLAMYFILVMIYFLFFSELKNTKINYLLAGLFGALGFLTHNFVSIYIITAVIALFLTWKSSKYPFLKFSKNGFYFLMALVVSLIPYFAWTYHYYGTILTSRFIYYPFAVDGWWVLIEYNNPNQVFTKFFATPFYYIVWIRISNAIVGLTPAILPINPLLTRYRSYDPIYYYVNLPGALTFLMYLLALLWFYRYITKKNSTNTTLVMLIIFPIIFNLVMYGWLGWDAINNIHPTLVILLMIGFNELLNFKNAKITGMYIKLLFIGALLEGFILSYLNSNLYQHQGGLDYINDGVRQFIPNFQIETFVSAHFLLNSNNESLGNLIVFLSIILIIYRYSKKFLY